MESRAETLIILSPGFAADEQDTSCIPPLQLFVKALREDCPGLNIVLIAFQYPHTAGEYDWHGVKVLAIGGKNNGRLARLGTWIKAWRILEKQRRNHDLLGILSFWLGECALIGSRFARRYKLTHYTWVQGQDARPGNKYVRRIKPQRESVIALSDFIDRELKKNYGIKAVQVIPIGIDTGLFGPVPARRDIDLLGVGSLIPLKQYHLFVEAVAFVKEVFPGVNAVICGKGPELEHLQQLARKYNVENNLVFAGELPYRETLAIMQRSKILAHPSSYEGYGAVIAEALYAGAHVVSFCKPMDKDYRHHHIVSSAGEMNRNLLSILKDTRRGHDPVTQCTAQQVAKNIISLFVA